MTINRKRISRRAIVPKIPKTKTKWQGLKANPHDFFGFIYLVTNTTNGKMYIGKKQFWMSKPLVKGCKSKLTDRQAPRWKPCCWKESDWRTYKGSSNSLTKDIKILGVSKFTFSIIKLCRSRGTLHYGEIEEQVKRGVLWKLMVGQGDDHQYYNRQIAACRFRPPAFYKDEEVLV